MQYTKVFVETMFAEVKPAVMGYVGGYYQWDNNWKLTGRFGVQSFGGAQLLNLTPFPSFTQPIVRFDLDRMDDNDNRMDAEAIVPVDPQNAALCDQELGRRSRSFISWHHRTARRRSRARLHW